MNRPFISILTPVWNGREYIHESVASVLGQDFADWELLVGDNGSTDGTREYLLSLDHPRVRVICHPQNLGIYGNLNALLDAARSEYCLVLCADDYLVPGGLASVARTWREVEGRTPGVIRFNWGLLAQRGGMFRFSTEAFPRHVAASDAALAFLLFGNLGGNLSNVSFSRSAVQAVGGFPLHLPFSGDFLIWARVARHSGMLLAKDVVSHVRRHEKVASNYLNRNGELARENWAVASELTQAIDNAMPIDGLLRLHATLSYDALQRDIGVKQLLLKRKATYLRNVEESARKSGLAFGWLGCWLAFFLSGGGRWGRVPVARAILAAWRKRSVT